MGGKRAAVWVEEVGRLYGFLARAAGTRIARGLPMQVMFGVGGEQDLTEREIPRLSGWRGSGPVRTGNGAWTQHQQDVYGAVLDAAWVLREQLEPVDDATRTFLVAAVEAAARRWRDPD